MALRKLAGILSAVGSAATLVAYARYRREIRSIRAAVDCGGTIANTAVGPIEYAEAGAGKPLLLIHGAGGGYDQGLLIGRDYGEGFRVIAPSRFGYLKTPVPADPSPAAQADAHAALLNLLGVDTCIAMGVSAGAPSAIEFALRYPARTEALVLLVPRTFDPTDSIGVDEGLRAQAVLRLVEASADFLYWLAIRVARASVVQFLGVKSELEAAATESERARMTEMMRSILPVSRRIRGIAVDSSIAVKPWPLERVGAPTLIVSAPDDLYKTLPGARFTAASIPGAELKILESGGHMMLGQSERVRTWIEDFLARRVSSPASKRRHRKAAAPRELMNA